MQHKHKPGKYIPALLFLSVLLLAIYSFFRILSIREEAEGRQYYADIYSEGTGGGGHPAAGAGGDRTL